ASCARADVNCPIYPQQTASCVEHRPAAQHQAEPVARDWPKIDAAMLDYVAGYEMIGDNNEVCYSPTKAEQELIIDCVRGLLAESDFINLLTAQPPAWAAPDGSVPVPLGFLQAFHALAHNYSLQAQAPDHYVGTERDAFSAAYARCGNELAKLRAMLAATPQGAAAGWIDPNDKTQKQYLPHIGEPVLFCHDGVTYYGQHTGGSFETVNGFAVKFFETWDCLWMYPPAAAQKGGAA
ncbi:MAG: hypothetical protein ACRC02_03900, partial [Vogesella sp.]|uniref:hypothetical protein n=1 Tax=Vogesella sp. TaxID=1904252 RepID=UPI003F34F1CF